MKGDNEIVLNYESVLEAIQEYLSKRFAEGHIPVVMGWEYKAQSYGPSQHIVKVRDPHKFLDQGDKP